MRSKEDKGRLKHGQAQEISGSSNSNFDFHKGNSVNRTSHHRTALGKPTPSKWDDAQKWLVNLSKGGESKTEPRNSNADDRRLIAPVPQKDYSSSDDDEEKNEFNNSTTVIRYEVETKNVDCDDTVWRIDRPENSASIVRSICVRDMGTEMTPIASQEPSRTATPIRATSPVARSPISSRSSTPVRCQNGIPPIKSCQVSVVSTVDRGEAAKVSGSTTRPWEREDSNANNVVEDKNSDQARKLSPLETQAMAWDEAERAKYMARYKGEEVRIQAWENHEKRKAEMEMKRMEVKAERLKSRAQERYTNKIAAVRRIAEEKRANAEAKLNEKAVQTSERADYIRRTGHLPSSFSFKLPSFCW